MSKHTRIHAKTDQHEVTAHVNETDSPILPVAQIEQLHGFRPDRVDWVFDQTEKEADRRRQETQRINTLIFTERLLGVLCAFVLGMTGLVGSIWLASQGRETAASTIGGITLVSLVSAFIYASRRK